MVGNIRQKIGRIEIPIVLSRVLGGGNITSSILYPRLRYDEFRLQETKVFRVKNRTPGTYVKDESQRIDTLHLILIWMD